MITDMSPAPEIPGPATPRSTNAAIGSSEEDPAEPSRCSCSVKLTLKREDVNPGGAAKCSNRVERSRPYLTCIDRLTCVNDLQ
jgi:hypothetical protein